jgi:UDP-2,4-diacetamido-2,4,6-trideoxy-beta-L-altropyranose hydrolase
MTIIFRADSSSTIGTGHIMRDLVLAKQYKGGTIIFATQNLQGNLNSKILESGYSLEILDDNSLNDFQKVIDKYNPDLVVIDSYNIDYEFEKKLKTQNPKLKLLSFDDTYEKHYCDILLNHNISADKRKYKDLLPEYCELRCGVEYTLLRDEFIQQKKSKSIFLAMGGADHSNLNIDILKVLEDFKYIDVNLVTTTANQNLEELKEYTKDKYWIELHINSNRIAKLMRVSDFAIITPSVTLNEVFFMELPFIAIKTADNQEDMAQYLKNNKYRILEYFDSIKLDKMIKEYLKNKGTNNDI